MASLLTSVIAVAIPLLLFGAMFALVARSAPRPDQEARAGARRSQYLYWSWLGYFVSSVLIYTLIKDAFSGSLQTPGALVMVALAIAIGTLGFLSQRRAGRNHQ